MSRPTKLTPKLIDLVEEAMNLGMTVDMASDYCGVSRSTFYSWLSAGQQEPDGLRSQFSDAVRQGRARCAARLLASMNAAALTDWRAAAWLLQRRYGYDSGMFSREERTIDETTIAQAADIQELMLRLSQIGIEPQLSGPSPMVVHESL